ncbi:uncharacterized protein SRS1_13374 [Sporisorium reilianum f. sp. reilianum]|uniref:Effector family protein Eff1 n=1 Tax=Sporisorium reilianum f. sp. reilianum TaxID=72559 RepID=A0A2N8UCT9_9BASI|nr:uncharacterized protein SRS1_13374 [Sporisorium reilianum f. sp. reilianum]
MFVSTTKLLCFSALLACCLVHAAPMWDPYYAYHQQGTSQPAEGAAQTWQAGSNPYWHSVEAPAQFGTANHGAAHPSYRAMDAPSEQPLDEYSWQMLDTIHRDLLQTPGSSAQGASGSALPPGSHGTHGAGFDPSGPTTRPKQASTPRHYRNWAIPHSLMKLGRNNAIKDENFVKGIEVWEDFQMQSLINSKFFEDHFVWIKKSDSLIRDSSWNERTPRRIMSRTMPGLAVFGPDRKEMPVYMTEHNVKSKLRVGPFQEKPYMAFWTIRDDPKSSKKSMVFLGTGYVKPEHYDDVNDAIDRWLAEVKRQASHARA